VATISNTTGTQGLAAGAGVGTATITATLSGVSGSTGLTVTAATLSSLVVTPANPTIAKGTTLQFTATGTYSDSSVQDLTALVTWTSSATAVATVSNAAGSHGLATGAAIGTTTVTATSGSVSGATGLTVTAATLSALQVTPANPTIAKGTTQQFVATGIYTDLTTQDLTAQVTWSSSATTVATISNAAGTQGLATAVAQGGATITATHLGVTGSTALTVTAETLVSLDVQPVDPTVAKGTLQQFRVIGTFTDNSTQDLTESATWSSGTTSVATVSNAVGSHGLVTTLAVGSSIITATTGGKSDTSTITVTAATLTSIAVTPAGPSVPFGSKQQFVATGTYSDSTTQDLTTQVTWASSATAVATISNTAGSQGLATTASPGASTISATLATVTGSTTLNVTAAALASISVSPTNPSVAAGYKLQFTATGLYTDGTTQNLTTSVTWASSSTGVATISNAAGTNGLATVAAAGTTTISATLSGKTGSTTLTGTNVTLSSIAVTPNPGTVAVRQKLQMTATGTFSDGSKLDVTTQVSWSSSAKKVASVSSVGLVSGIKAGSSTIKASKGAGKNGVSGTASVTVQ
jgi:hypothetical protein